jgi:glycosyltransferase involved in cell wall biosynthesis
MELNVGGNVLTRQRERTSTVSVVLPARNEAANIGWVLERLPEEVREVIVVDGQSTDGTVDVARSVRPDVIVVHEPQPGKGAALRAGFRRASGDIVVMLDADGSMDPAEITPFVNAIEDGCDVVKGSRFLEGGGSRDLTWFRSTGNRVLRGLVNMLWSSSFTELCYGYFAFRRSALDALGLRADGFEIETEIVLRSIEAGLVIGEVPSFEAIRFSGQSNLHPVRDGVRVLRTVVTQKVKPDDRVIDITDARLQRDREAEQRRAAEAVPQSLSQGAS